MREQFFETEADQDPPDSETKCFNIPPTETQFTVPDLAHTTQWDFTLMVISDRYFEACQDKKMKNLTEIPLEMRFEKIVNHWLPYVTLSSSTLPKEDIRSLVISKLKPNSITLKWATFTSPNDDSVELEYEKQVVSFNEYSENVGGQSTRYFDSVSVDPEARRFTLSDLEPATVYQINLEGMIFHTNVLLPYFQIYFYNLWTVKKICRFFVCHLYYSLTFAKCSDYQVGGNFVIGCSNFVSFFHVKIWHEVNIF